MKRKKISREMWNRINQEQVDAGVAHIKAFSEMRSASGMGKNMHARIVQLHESKVRAAEAYGWPIPRNEYLDKVAAQHRRMKEKIEAKRKMEVAAQKRERARRKKIIEAIKTRKARQKQRSR